MSTPGTHQFLDLYYTFIFWAHWLELDMMVILMGFHLEFAQLFQENLSNLIQGVNFAELEMGLQ